VNRKPLAIVASVAILLIGVSFYILTHRERVHIRARVEAMRQAIRNNDTAGVAALVMPTARSAYQTKEGLEHFRVHVGTDKSVPSVSVTGDYATVTPHRKYHFDKVLKGNPLGILPGGNAFDMLKENGEWYFTGVVHID